MPAKRRGAHKKQHVSSASSTASAASAPSGPLFTSSVRPGTLLTLRFASSAAQHAALSRMEAFYEGAVASIEGEGMGETGTYMTLEQAKEARLCRNYEAFNLPMDACRAWLAQMQLMEESSTDAVATVSEEGEAEEKAWWARHCNAEERQLLTHLTTLGALEASPPSSAPRYLISILTSQPSSLTHELQHALFFLSASFRTASRAAFATLTARERKVVELDLARRGYAPHVWTDEFQAYINEDVGEFGNVTKEACAEAREMLKGIRESAMKEEGLLEQ